LSPASGDKDALGLKLSKRFSDGWATHPQPHGQLTFGGYPVTGPVFARIDEAAELFGDLVGDSLWCDRAKPALR
jgi:hypothetical protein